MGQTGADFSGTDRFVVRARLGGGGMGVVFRVHDAQRGNDVALKTLRTRDAASLLRFKNEFRSLTDVSHPNLVSLYELHADGEQWFFTMELIEGADFMQYVGVRRPEAPTNPVERDDTGDDRTTRVTSPHPDGPQLDVACDLVRLRPALRQLAEGVCALHESGHLHRDIKPSNVLISAIGQVKLLDFGVITELAGVDRDRGEIVGTPKYMAPEQADAGAVAASDWYSVGLILYECLTGVSPFPGDPAFALASKRSHAPRPPGELVGGVPRDLDELCRALLDPDPSKRPSGADVLARLGAIGPRRTVLAEGTGPVLVRPALIDALHAELAETQRGAGRVVYVHGASGMGKTSLVRQFLEDARWLHDAVVLEGRCYERESVPFKAFDAAIDSLGDHLAALPRDEVEALIPRDVLALAQAFPVLRRVEAIAAARRRTNASPDPQEQRRRAFGALRDLFGRIAERRPLVVFIDDLHWSDLESAQLLEAVLRAPSPPPMLVVASYRTDDAKRNPALGPLLDGAPFESRRLHVDPLDADEAKTFAAHLLSRAGLGGELAESIAREAGGSPLLIHALAHQARAHPEAAHASVTLEEVLRARLEGLSSRAQRLLEIVALAGRPLAQGVARAAAELDRAGFDDSVQALRIASLVRTSGARDDDLIEGYHDRVRETVAAMISPERQRTRYARLATAIETSSAPDPDALATYFHRAGDDVTAATYAVQAAKRAFAALSFDHAARLYQDALAYGAPGPADERALHTAIGESLAAAGRGLAAAEAFAAAAALADGDAAIELERLAAEQEMRSGHVDAGRRRLAAVLTRLGVRFPGGPRRAILGLLGRRAQLRLRGLEPKTRDPSTITDRDRMRVDACWSASAGLGPIDPPSAGVFATRNVLLSLRLGDPHRVVRALAVEAMFVGSAGGRARKRADQLAGAARRIADEIGDPYGRAFAISAAAFAAFEAGAWAEAHDLTGQGLAMLLDHCAGIDWEVGTMRRFALLSMIYLGRWRELSAMTMPHLRDAEQRGDLYSLTNIRAVILPFVRLLEGDPAGAHDEATRALQGWGRDDFDDQHFMAGTGHVIADLYSDDAPRALAQMHAIEQPMARSTLRYVQVIRGHWSFYLGTASASAAAAGAGDGKALLRRASRLAKHLLGEKVPWCEGYGRCVQASVALARGRDADAVPLLRAAIAALDRADMAMMAEAVRYRLGAVLGGDEGAALITAATDRFAGQGMRDVAAAARILVLARR
ncbi:MAG TPA: AAA family ATPase [Kofleriaceae bacterium]|nr:AAA family ATPase [Kofleriaceae bacterium]